MSRATAAGLALAALRLVIAAAIFGAVAYVLSWQILFDGLPRGDTLFHLHLTTFVASTFPGLPQWWYPWDGNGLPFREGYPLISHWLAVAASRLYGTNLTGGIQIVDFLVSPVCALGVYAFCDWRFRRPLAGLIAGVLYLLSPMSWFGVFSLGVFTDQVSTTLFMPAMIALDVVATKWASGDRGWHFRSAVVAFCALSSGVGLIAPAQWPGALGAVPLYALAIPAADRKRWVLAVTPALWAVAGLLAVFWLFPIRDYLGFIGSHSPSLVFNPSDISLLHLDTVLQLHPLSTNSSDRYSLSPAASIPALLGFVAAVWERRSRVLATLVGLALVFGTQGWALAPLGLIPNAQQFTGVVHRPAVLYLQFLVPVLAGLGLVLVPQAILVRLVRRAGAIRPRGARFTGRAAEVVASPIAVVAVAALIITFAGYVDGNQGDLSYGPGHANLRDIWQRHDSTCTDPGANSNPLCQSTLTDQLLDPTQWRAPTVGCLLAKCREFEGTIASMQSIFQQPPQRAAVNSDNYLFGMAFHEISGGASDYTYAGQLVPSDALNSWLVDNTLHSRGTEVKAQLAQVLGLDTVALAGPSQLGQAADYVALGWRSIGKATAIDVYRNPSPTGLGEQWPSGSDILVIGASQSSSADVYNNMFKYATSGRIPYSEGWIVRGRSPYIDDYSREELSSYRAVVLLGYRYRDHDAAWNLVDQYALAGGRVYVESGWQFVNPDWSSQTAPDVLPVKDVRWGELDQNAPVSVNGVNDPTWGSMSYQGRGWGASSSSSVRPGAEALVTVGNRVVVARWTRGKGEVVWSGMNLLAHDASVRSLSEDAFVSDQFGWLLPTPTPQIDVAPSWRGNDQVALALSASAEPSLVLFKESMFPGWSARLETPGTTRSVTIVDSEMDFMLVRLDSVPAGSRLVFTYAPTLRLEAWWAVSALGLGGLVLWLVRPGLAGRPWRWVSGRLSPRLRRWNPLGWDDE